MKKSQFRASLLAASALSISIASQIHAAAFISAASGTWEDPASWTAAAGFPDTFGADSATITGGAMITYDDFGGTPLNGGGVSTPATPFTIALALNPGGLSVANGNSVNIDSASVLTQANLLNEIRIGEGAGATSGAGTLNIDGGGIFLSGSSLGVAVGSDIDSNVGNGTGNGTVNLKNGLFIMDIGGGPATASLGVGIEGATGVFNVGDGAGAAGEAILDLKTNNNAFGAGVTNQLPGSTLAGTGTVNIKSDGLLTFGTGQLVFGDTATGVGNLNIDGGTLGEGAASTGAIRIGIGGGSGVLTVTSGVINSGGDLSVGRGAGSTGLATISGGTTLANHLIFGDGGTGTVNLSGATTQLNSTLNLNVGTNGGVGHINQTGGAVTYSEWSAIGVGAGAAGSSWDISGGSITSGAGFEVGSDRDGTFNVSGTAVVSVGPLEAGIRTGSNGHINITAGSVTTTRLGIAGAQGGGATGDATISGTANVTITGGGGQSYIGNNGGSVGTLNIVGVTVNNTSGQDLQIGFNGGTGNLNVTAGGKLNDNWWINVARGGTSTGNVLVDGVGSEIDNDNSVDIRTNIGENGVGTLDVKNGGIVRTMEFFAGREGGSTGNVNINSGGKVTFQDWMEVGSRGGVGTINIDGVGSTLENIGGGDGRNGGRGGDAQIGYNGGTGNINITNGGTLKTGWWLNVARGGGSTGNILVDGPGSNITVGTTGGDVFLNVGEDATGNMTVSNGGLVKHNGAESYRTRIGANGGSVGTVNVVSGGQFDTTELFVANSGNSTGTLNISSGGKVTAQNWMSVGQGGGAVGTVTIDGVGSQLIARSPLFGRNGGNGGDTNIGQGGGTGTVNIKNGGSMDAGWWLILGRDGGSTGTVEVDGATGPSFLSVGTVGADARLSVGAQGTGTLNIINGGVVVANTNGEGTMVGQDGGSNGTININSGGSFTSGRWLTIANGGGSTGVVNLDGAGSSINLTGSQNANPEEAARLFVGRFGTGTLNQTGGTISFGGWSGIGFDPGSVGTYNLSGGEINTPAERDYDWFVGRAGGAKGTLNISNNAHFALSTDAANPDIGQRNGARLIVGTDDGSEGTLNIDGTALVEVRELSILNGKGTITQNGGTVNVGRWLKIGEGNNANDAANPALYTINNGVINTPELMVGEGRKGSMIVHGGTVNITAGSFAVGRWGPAFGAGNHGDGTLTQDGGAIVANGDLNIGVQAGATGTYTLTGGTIAVNSIHAQGGGATLNLGPGKVIANQDNGTFIDGFTNSGGHSAINLTGTGTTIDSNGHIIRITQTNVFSDTDVLVNGLAGTVFNKDGLGTLTIESALDTDGTLSVHVLKGTLDLEASQVLDALVIDDGATVTLSALSSPPAPPEAPAALFDGAPTADSLVSVQGVPEPGTIGLILVSALGMLGRRNRRKDS